MVFNVSCSADADVAGSYEKCKRGHQRMSQRLASTINPKMNAPKELLQQQQGPLAPACKEKEHLCISAEACANIAKAQQRYEVQMPECTCEAGENDAAETLQSLEGLSVTDTFDGATVLITGATGYIGSLVRPTVSVAGNIIPPPAE